MRKFVGIVGLAALFCLALPAALAAAPPAAKSGPGTIVIVFKDGHRQVYNLSDIERVEFPAGGIAATDANGVNSASPSRARFLGKWEVGDGNGSSFYIRLEETGDAHRSLGNVHGRWAYVDGEARVTWDDGAQDAIRKVGPAFQKFAYAMGKSFTDVPDNVTTARNTTPHPI
jgi:hypothetical protein